MKIIYKKKKKKGIEQLKTGLLLLFTLNSPYIIINGSQFWNVNLWLVEITIMISDGDNVILLERKTQEANKRLLKVRTLKSQKASFKK